MRLLYLLKRNASLLTRRYGLVIALILACFGQPVAAQAESPPLGVRWALWLGQPVTALTLLDESSASAGRLLVTGPTAAAVIDPHTAAIAWQYQRPTPGEDFGALPLRHNVLYFYSTALDVSTGKILWQMPVSDQGPLLLTDEALYLLGRTAIMAVNPQTGALLWQNANSEQGSILAGDEVLYIVGTHFVQAVGRANGTVRWTTPIETDPEVKPLLVGDKLMVGLREYRFQALNIRTGQPGDPLPFHHLLGYDQTTGLIYGLADEASRYLPGQVLAFGPAREEILWRYPTTDPNGIYLTPPLVPQPKPLWDGDAIYIVNNEERVVALDTAGGTPRWISEPLPQRTSFGPIYRIGQRLIIPGNSLTSSSVLDLRTGEIQTQSDFFGDLAGVVAGKVILEETSIAQWDQEQLGIPGQLFTQDFDNITLSRLNLRQTETGQLLLGNLILSQTPQPGTVALPPIPAVTDASGFIYFAQDEFVYTVGPAAPGEAVAAARQFLAGGDYRSASRTLSLLKTSDEAGYLAHGGETVAAEALNAWLAEANLLLTRNRDDLANFIVSPALRHAIGLLQINEASAHLQYLRAELQVHAYTDQCQSDCRPVDELSEVRQLQEKFGDTAWAEQLEPLLAAKRDQAIPHLNLGASLNLKWYYLPCLLPIVLFLVAAVINLRQANLYRAGITAFLIWWGGLTYLFWATYQKFITQFQYLTICLDFGLVGSLSLAVWWLTRSKAYATVAFGASLVYILARWLIAPPSP